MNKQEIRKIVLAGSGNVAWHLGRRMHEKGFEIMQVYGRNRDTAGELAGLIGAEMTTDVLSVKRETDAYIIPVSDNAVKEIAGKLKPGNTIIIHTAGSIGIDVFKGIAANYGVIYPLQTFTRSRDVDFNDVPLFIEANNNITLSAIKSLALSLSPHVYEADSLKRLKLHLAAVFACNFTNHMYAVAERLLKENGMSFDLLRPLIRETLDKAVSLSPHNAQTGPAVRNSKSIMDLHLKMLQDDPDLWEMYEIISRSIMLSRISGG